MPNDLPNVLLISSSVPQSKSASGLVLLRMLQNYPPRQLLILGPQPPADAQLLPSRYEPINFALERLHRTRFPSLAKIERSLESLRLLPHLTDRMIQKRLKGFQPQVVLTLFERGFHRDAHRFARARNLPLIIIIHDQYALLDPVYPWANSARHKQDAAAYQYAKARLCVSPEMEHALAQSLHAPGAVLYPARSPAITPRPTEENLTLRNPPHLTVGFAGTLSLGYGRQLAAMTQSFRDSNTRLRIYSRSSLEEFPPLAASPDVFTHAGFAPTPEQAWIQIKQECDAVILPYQLDAPPDLLNVYNTHFPSKLTEYTALQMPILVIGPPTATGLKWMQQNAPAAILEPNPAPQLQSLRDNPALRTTAALQAYQAGLKDFDPAAITANFIEHLRSAAK